MENIEILETLASISKPLHSVKTGELTTTSAYVKELYHELRSTALKKLEEKKQKCEKEGISCKIIIVIENPMEQIVKYIQEQKIDLVVMGTARRKGVSKIMTLGSVARKVSENAPCPVMLVH